MKGRIVMKYNHLEFNLENRVRFLPGKGCLVNHQGEVVSLPENSLRFLLLLLEGVTEKEVIIDEVWREQKGAISESSYYGQLHTLRNAFLQVGLAKNLIRTIPRKGVRYVGLVEREELKLKPVENTEFLKKSQEHSMVPLALETVSLLPERIEESREVSQNTLVGRLTDKIRKVGIWNIFVSVLSIISVFWLTFLTFFR
jgi:DNA-binding winged helix-turn-helix (wHTH) protein